LDVGSGNGSPGLVLGVLRPDVAVTLLEPRQRRWAFLREAARVVGRADAVILRCRHDGYSGPPAKNVTVRALGLPPDALAALIAAEGRLLIVGGPPLAAQQLRFVGSRSNGPAPVHIYCR
jgi:16S rRNA (guanine527-N7)-methyltransferase